jgi:hypothetical protein
LISCSDENIDDEILIMIARNLGEEWITLYQTLGISKSYVNLIMKMNKRLETNVNNFEDKYDVLRYWVLHQLKFVPKVF